jgi:hypothetical protein
MILFDPDREQGEGSPLASQKIKLGKCPGLSDYLIDIARLD